MNTIEFLLQMFTTHYSNTQWILRSVVIRVNEANSIWVSVRSCMYSCIMCMLRLFGRSVGRSLVRLLTNSLSNVYTSYTWGLVHAINQAWIHFKFHRIFIPQILPKKHTQIFLTMQKNIKFYTSFRILIECFLWFTTCMYPAREQINWLYKIVHSSKDIWWFAD